MTQILLRPVAIQRYLEILRLTNFFLRKMESTLLQNVTYLNYLHFLYFISILTITSFIIHTAEIVCEPCHFTILSTNYMQLYLRFKNKLTSCSCGILSSLNQQKNRTFVKSENALYCFPKELRCLRTNFSGFSNSQISKIEAQLPRSDLLPYICTVQIHLLPTLLFRFM